MPDAKLPDAKLPANLPNCRTADEQSALSQDRDVCVAAYFTRHSHSRSYVCVLLDVSTQPYVRTYQ